MWSRCIYIVGLGPRFYSTVRRSSADLVGVCCGGLLQGDLVTEALELPDGATLDAHAVAAQVVIGAVVVVLVRITQDVVDDLEDMPGLARATMAFLPLRRTARCW
jgi:hypothetical protein